MHHNQRLAQGRSISRVKGGVTLFVFLTKAHNHDIGICNRLTGANGVYLCAFVIVPEFLILSSQNGHAAIITSGVIVQQGDPQEILLRPAARYIEEFIQDINRARVLKVKSIMSPAKTKRGCGDVVRGDDTLEAVINAHKGRIDGTFAVSDPNDATKIIGKVKMEDIYRALVRPQMQHD